MNQSKETLSSIKKSCESSKRKETQESFRLEEAWANKSQDCAVSMLINSKKFYVRRILCNKFQDYDI